MLIALGGNALILPGEKGYIEEQFKHASECMKPIALLIAQGGKIAITHGNGPIVGNILLRNECAMSYIPPMPLHICVADSQGGIGAMLSLALKNELRRIGLEKTISTIITHVVVKTDDPAFREATKPIGPYYSDDDAEQHIRDGWKMRKIEERGWRRIVPSPNPTRIVETAAIVAAFEKGIIPIASGGGGIPVTEEGGDLRGVDAVIDKDLSASLLACNLSVKMLTIITDVDGVYLDWGSSKRRKLDSISLESAKGYLEKELFPPGSMGPKIKAAVQFVESGGDRVIITKSEDLLEAMEGKAGTSITR